MHHCAPTFTSELTGSKYVIFLRKRAKNAANNYQAVASDVLATNYANYMHRYTTTALSWREVMLMARPIFMIDDLECAVLIAFLAQYSKNSK